MFGYSVVLNIYNYNSSLFTYQISHSFTDRYLTGRYTSSQIILSNVHIPPCKYYTYILIKSTYKFVASSF
nr:MAG TPA: hypothetical protein [Herelleviridae sp.]